MIPGRITRLPTTTKTTTTIVFLSSLPHLVSAYILPRETGVVPLRELNVVDYPLALATPGPALPVELGRRDFNTICGYIGGDAALPATCMAGSHCVVEIDHGAVGCCPDGGTCTRGIFTGCVDVNSPPQAVLDPYVYTCSGSEVCYKNNFEGGYYQYGCGTASHLATTVATTAYRHSALDFSRVAVALTAQPITLATPTTIGSRPPKHHSWWTSVRSGSTISSEVAASLVTGTAAGFATSLPLAAPSGSDPYDDDKRPSGSIVGGVIGGVVGGVSVFVVGCMFGFFCLRRSRGAQPKSYIQPNTEEKPEPRTPSRSPQSCSTQRSLRSPMSLASVPAQEIYVRPAENASPATSNIGLAVPLEAPAAVKNKSLDEVLLDGDGEKIHQSDAASIYEADSYPGPRRAGGGSFWSQTRSQPRSRDRSWRKT